MELEKLKSWLSLWRMPNIGINHFHTIYQKFSNLEDFFQTSASWRREHNLPEELIIDEKGINQDLNWLEENKNHRVLTLADNNYPHKLREIASAPPILFVKGNDDLLKVSQIAVVGSRNPTPYGIETAHTFAKALVHAGFVITSGLALGIDSASHRGALMNDGKTIAVLGCSLEQIYPKRNKELANEIVSRGGAIISEFPMGSPALAEHFPRRNRIISGLSHGVLVVEASLHSGSLITARFANEQGREVFAIPGSINNPIAAGCHALIKQGAKLTETYQDILEEIAPFLTTDPLLPPPKVQSSLDKNQQKLLKSISFEPTPVDQLVERSQLPIIEVISLLATLELQGHILATARGYVRA